MSRYIPGRERTYSQILENDKKFQQFPTVRASLLATTHHYRALPTERDNHSTSWKQVNSRIVGRLLRLLYSLLAACPSCDITSCQRSYERAPVGLEREALPKHRWSPRESGTKAIGDVLATGCGLSDPIHFLPMLNLSNSRIWGD